ncbi:MAG TPA: DMT family transporter [Candidatus Dormibacteraeota bacterium]|nr:DMT family transporter [Candidatus Dormibacteraeota bacterium]
MRATRFRGILLASGGAVVFSFDGLLIRLQSLSPAGIMFWRSVFATIAYGAMAFVAARAIQPGTDPLRKSWAPLLLITPLALLSNTTFVFSITHTAVSQTLVIVASVPIVTGILGYFALHERLPLRTWLAGATCLIGVVAVVAGNAGSVDLQGDLWGVASLAISAVLLVAFRRYPNASRLLALMVAALAADLVFSKWARPFPDSRTAIAAAVDGMLLVPGGWLLTSLAPRYLPAAEVGLFMLIETVLAPLWVFIIVGEVPTYAVVLSGAVILGAIAVHSWLDLRSPSGSCPSLGASNDREDIYPEQLG